MKHYQKKDACFVCTTPYQVMGAISIVMGKGLDADIYIFGMFSNYVDISNRLREVSIFSNVISIEAQKYKKPGRKGAIIQILFSKIIVGKFLQKNISYRYFYTSSRAHIKNLFLHELLDRSKDMRIVIYDDGLGTYSKDSHVLNTTKLRNRVEKVLGWNLYNPDKIKFMVHIPELFDKPDRLKKCNVVKMPTIYWNKKNREMFMNIFGVEKSDLIDEDIIIFDTLRGLNREDDKKIKILDYCYDIVVNEFGINHVILKPHPRSNVEDRSIAKRYIKSYIPMEVLYAGMENLNERILITYASSAVYSPKIFFDAEPIIINLFKMVDNVDGSISEWEESYYKFKRIYRNSWKVMAPETIDEFKQCIGRVNRHEI